MKHIGFTLLVAATALVQMAPAETSRQPNILLILSDDQRWDTLGCYGNASIRTPNLDKLAAGGARLDRLYITPLCAPSRGAMLTGLYPHQNGVETNEKPILKNGVRTVADYFNQAGYVTGFIGKAHVAGGPVRYGFQEYPIWLPGGGLESETARLVIDGQTRDFKELHDPNRRQRFATHKFVDAALQFGEKHQARPWLLWLALTAPHSTEMDPKHPYRNEDIKTPPGFFGKKPANWAKYYSTISMLDEECGRLLDKLDQLGLAENTLIAFIGDNGFMFGSHGYRGKGIWFEEAVRVPGVIRWPARIKPGTVITSLVESLDWVPTVLDAAGIEKPASLPGLSLLPALTGASSAPRRSVVHLECDNQEVNRERGNNDLPTGIWRMVRTERYKYVRYRDSDTQYLYDLQQDPGEELNLIHSQQRAGVLNELRELHESWLKQTP